MTEHFAAPHACRCASITQLFRRCAFLSTSEHPLRTLRMFLVPASRVKYLWKIIHEVLRVLELFRALILRGQRVLRVFWVFLYTFRYFNSRGSILWLVRVLAFDTLEYFLYMKIFRGLVLLIVWVLSVSKFSEYAQYTRSMSYTSTVSPPLRPFHLVFWKKTFTDGCGGSR